ncbi:MAG: response regulator transcription factor [Coprobacillus sp.]|nr:response regulator transcription factor [Coprobacillus sp.]
MKLLLAEDDRDISSVIVKFLQKNNYLVDAVYDGKEALQYLDCEKYDGVILDVMMPKMDGITVVRNMRKKGDNTPVLILTAKAEIDDKVLGLDAGADDYLTKPFSMKEFLARIRALTRRKNTTLSTFSFGNIILNPKTYEIISQTDKVRLSAKEYQVMEILINNSNSLVSTEMLMDKVWGFDSDAEINVVWVYISVLRKKLQAINANLTISAIRGLGYKLEEK